MTSTKFELLEWAAAGNDLLERSRRKLSSAPSEKMQQLADKVPTTILSEDNTVVLVFAGQYSAGKSTIIKALTGREDIATGAGITTEQAHTYDWASRLLTRPACIPSFGLSTTRSPIGPLPMLIS
jgi:GTP-binding protein EngB required for normal cell division